MEVLLSNWAHRLEATAVFSGTMYSVLSTWKREMMTSAFNGILLVLVYSSGRITKKLTFSLYSLRCISEVYIYQKYIIDIIGQLYYGPILISLHMIWFDAPEDFLLTSISFAVKYQARTQLWHRSLIWIPLSSPKSWCFPSTPPKPNMEPNNWWVGLMFLLFQGWIFRYLPTESHHGNRRQLSSRAAGGIFLGR